MRKHNLVSQYPELAPHASYYQPGRTNLSKGQVRTREIKIEQDTAKKNIKENKHA